MENTTATTNTPAANENKKAFDLKAELLSLASREEVVITIKPQAIAVTIAPLVGAIKSLVETEKDLSGSFKSVDEKVHTLDHVFGIVKEKIIPQLAEVSMVTLKEFYRLFLEGVDGPVGSIKPKTPEAFRGLVEIK